MAKLPPPPTTHPLPFVDLMALEQLSPTTFRSTARSFMPGVWTETGGVLNRSYGAHYFAQAVLAAAREMEGRGVRGFCVHSTTAAFTTTGNSELPYVYAVSTVREGKGFAVKNVLVTQESSPDPCLSCLVSFKRMGPEQGLDFQDRLDLTEYESVLRDKQPWEHPRHLAIETPWVRHLAATSPTYHAHEPIFPGLHQHKVDMSAYNDPRAPLDRRALTYYAPVGPLPSVRDDPNMHAAAHIYAADRNCFMAVDRFLNVHDNFSVMASLTYSVTFHGDGLGEAIALRDEKNEGRERWFLQEAWTDRFADGRATHHSRIWDEEGRHVVTTFEDGLIRLAFESEEELEDTRKAFKEGRAKGEERKEPRARSKI